MRSFQEEALATFFKNLRKGSVYNRKWWNPLSLSIYLHDIIASKQIRNVVELGTGNGVTAAWMALGGANVWTCDTAVRPKVWENENFPLPHIANRILAFEAESDRFLRTNAHSGPTPTIKSPELFFLDAATSEKSFRRDMKVVADVAEEDDIIVSPMGHSEIYNCWLKMASAGFKVRINSESFTLKWPNDGHLRSW